MKFEIPATFTLGGVEHVVEIQHTVRDGQDFGQYDPVRKVIQIAYTCGNRGVPQSFQQQTFLHEFVHAILNTMRKDDIMMTSLSSILSLPFSTRLSTR